MPDKRTPTDTERLEWLAQNQERQSLNTYAWPVFDVDHGWALFHNKDDRDIDGMESLRQAIDAAMQREAEGDE